jgi:hypothetical protein
VKKRIIVVVLLLVAFSGCIKPPPPTSNILYFFPLHSYGHVDEEVTVTIMLDATQPVRGWEATIAFNATILKVIRVEQGDLFNGDVFQSPNILIDNTNGSITRMYALAINHNISGSGILIKIIFRANLAGDTNILFIETAVYNTTGSIPSEVRDATIHIGP